MGAAQLWREWRRRFTDDDDLALGTLLDVADRLGRDQSAKQQEELRQLKRALLGDAFSEGEHLEAIGPDERARLPLPFAGVIRALKYVGVRRAGCRLWEAGQTTRLKWSRSESVAIQVAASESQGK